MANRQFTGPWQICGHCRGDGAHSHRLGAISVEEMDRDWDEEERERYFAGGYDEPCEECDGTGKVRAPANVAEEDAQETARESRANDRYWQRLEASACGEQD